MNSSTSPSNNRDSGEISLFDSKLWISLAGLLQALSATTGNFDGFVPIMWGVALWSFVVQSCISPRLRNRWLFSFGAFAFGLIMYLLPQIFNGLNVEIQYEARLDGQASKNLLIEVSNGRSQQIFCRALLVNFSERDGPELLGPRGSLNLWAWNPENSSDAGKPVALVPGATGRFVIAHIPPGQEQIPLAQRTLGFPSSNARDLLGTKRLLKGNYIEAVEIHCDKNPVVRKTLEFGFDGATISSVRPLN
ncbi:MAG: hypothetical protein ACOY6K_16210 [Pseudomonadota bacterium]